MCPICPNIRIVKVYLFIVRLITQVPTETNFLVCLQKKGDCLLSADYDCSVQICPKELY